MSSITEDAALRPELFIWNGPIPRVVLEEWLRVRSLEIPDDLAKFWCDTGGGCVFETETMLGPCADSRSGDDVDGVNAAHHSRGMSEDYLLVHVGCCLSAIRMHDGAWVTLDQDSYSEIAEYSSLEDWYIQVLRAEYADRYGLPF